MLEDFGIWHDEGSNWTLGQLLLSVIPQVLLLTWQLSI